MNCEIVYISDCEVACCSAAAAAYQLLALAGWLAAAAPCADVLYNTSSLGHASCSLIALNYSTPSMLRLLTFYTAQRTS